jgi:hypothetical protein
MQLMLVTVGKARTFNDSIEQVASSPAVAAPATGAATGAENPLAFLRYPPVARPYGESRSGSRPTAPSSVADP